MTYYLFLYYDEYEKELQYMILNYAKFDSDDNGQGHYYSEDDIVSANWYHHDNDNPEYYTDYFEEENAYTSYYSDPELSKLYSIALSYIFKEL
jgi:hypothetical protein